VVFICTRSIASPTKRSCVQSRREEAERARDALQREAASLDSQLHISNARLNEAHAEIRTLTGRHVMLQNRIDELERVIEKMREQEFRSRALVAQEQGSDPDSLLAVQVCIFFCVFRSDASGSDAHLL
jgi:septal ring factor EnvC (AmiA/AmiB activator)